MEVALHHRDNREHDIFDSDDYFQFHGGKVASIQALTANRGSVASAAGITTAVSRVERVADRPVFLLRRFDRECYVRRPFVSAMSMLGTADRETRSYLEIADAIQQYGAAHRRFA